VESTQRPQFGIPNLVGLFRSRYPVSRSGQKPRRVSIQPYDAQAIPDSGIKPTGLQLTRFFRYEDHMYDKENKFFTIFF
jgi:hypothetical protein